MAEKESVLEYILRMGDNALILGQRLSEWCGHGPVLEQDIAITNLALDLMGQARNWFQYYTELEGHERSEDQIAFLRDAWDFRNVLLVEYPNEDWAYTVVRQFLFDTFNLALHHELSKSENAQISAIAQKSLKEIKYHYKYSSEWMLRLGDGTELSHQKMQNALNDLWMYSGELTTPDPLDLEMAKSGIGADLDKIRDTVVEQTRSVIERATLSVPEGTWMMTGGKQGNHTEFLGHILTEMQFMQRTYPGLEW